MTSRDIGAQIAGRACAAVAATAGGAGDAAEVNGQWIDRQGFLSAKLIVAYQGVLGDGDTLSVAANLQDATDGSGTGAADFGTAAADAVRATGGSGGSTERGVVEIDVDLSGAKQFVRAQFTPNLSAANTDTAILSAVLVLGGAEAIPAV